MERRVASSKVTNKMEPNRTSPKPGLPTRNARSSKIQGMYKTLKAAAAASSQSSRGTPPGDHQLERWGSDCSRRVAANTKKIKPRTKAKCTPR